MNIAIKAVRFAGDIVFYAIVLMVGWILTIAFLAFGGLVIGMLLYAIAFLLSAGHPIAD